MRPDCMMLLCTQSINSLIDLDSLENTKVERRIKKHHNWAVRVVRFYLLNIKRHLTTTSLWAAGIYLNTQKPKNTHHASNAIKHRSELSRREIKTRSEMVKRRNGTICLFGLFISCSYINVPRPAFIVFTISLFVHDPPVLRWDFIITSGAWEIINIMRKMFNHDAWSFTPAGDIFLFFSHSW